MLNGGRNGFTLLELSIVLVIVGLIAGGVLVGRDLINAAEIQKEVKTLGALQIAINTFKVKYNAVPGDATQKQLGGGFSGVWDYGDGDGRLGCCDTNVDGQATFQEGAFAWEHLSKAGLIAGTYDGFLNWLGGPLIGGPPGVTIYWYCTPSSCPPTALNQTSAHFIGFPVGSIGGGVYRSPLLYSEDNTDPTYNTNWANIAILVKSAFVTFPASPPTGNLTVDQAYAIDVKLDDGVAYSGIVITRNSQSSNGCINGDSAGGPPGSPFDDGSADLSLGHPYDYNSSTDTADDCELIYVLR